MSSNAKSTAFSLTRVLVTGATGFIGRHSVSALREAGHEVVEAQRNAGDVADEDTWDSFPSADVVIHLAARTFVPDSWTNSGTYMRVNLLGTIGALEYCKKLGRRLVFVSSYLYGNPRCLPIREDAPLVASNPYALSKQLAEAACRFYFDSYGLDIVVIRPFNVYGPGQSLQYLIPSILQQLQNGRIIHVKDLEPKRDYVYVSDVADALAKAVNAPRGFNILNIGSGVSHSVSEVIEMIQEIAGVELTVLSDAERRKKEVLDSVADISRAHEVLGWKPRFSLRAGLSEMFRKGA